MTKFVYMALIRSQCPSDVWRPFQKDVPTSYKDLRARIMSGFNGEVTVLQEDMQYLETMHAYGFMVISLQNQNGISKYELMIHKLTIVEEP